MQSRESSDLDQTVNSFVFVLFEQTGLGGKLVQTFVFLWRINQSQLNDLYPYYFGLTRGILSGTIELYNFNDYRKLKKSSMASKELV
jgi:hypothetical protein